ncbi:efflux RND transporter periplasmic adaptor subunit [Lysobacter enzymogenes]|uniref:efflux RND transporter periplasmic adaptor subunit n=1 Tax=Lysobacter enzymogenes TaxID=69 RepID=UPI001A9717D7|nr:efflux RND transporter periplasmic adaptor subunit [Lysobacter enzymogenes]QQP97090.1 efflux RND transporter periplasmic adaptor subunit [Lysobacter enzymogenes]
MGSTPNASPAPPPPAAAVRDSWPRRHRGVLLTLLGVAALLALAWWLVHGRAANERGNRRPTATVGIAVARAGSIPITLEALGTVTPLATATVRPQVSGNIVEIAFKEGQTVRQGEVLLRIDPRPFQLALDQARGALARDEAQLQVARLTLKRYAPLAHDQTIAQQDYDTQAATVQQLTGVVAADRAAIGTASLNLDYTQVRAPIAGRVGLRVVDLGNYVTPGDAAGVAVISAVSPIDVEFTAPQDDLPRIQARLARGDPPAATVLDRTRTQVLGQGRFLTLDNAIDPGTGTVKAKARFGNDDARLFPSQFVNVRVLLDTLPDAVTVPAAALRTGPNGDFVYVVGADRKAQLRKVTRGPAAGDTVAVTQGLKLGEQVVISGGDQLSDGAAVRLPGDAGASGANGAGKAAGGEGRGHRRAHGAAGEGGASQRGEGQ